MRLWIAVGGLLSLGLAWVMAGTPAERASRLTRSEMQAVVQFLSDDLIEGRAPGTRGGQLAETYMESVFKLLGLAPGWKESYSQPFTLDGFESHDVRLQAGAVTLEQFDALMGTWRGPSGPFKFTGEAVFVGFGIRTPIWSWDDFKDADFAGKILFVRANDPGLFQGEIFEGSQLTVFGRWSYKIEEAARAGAAAVILIHTDETAGYGWDVVRNSWSGEQVYLPPPPGFPLKFSGWVTETGFRRILERAGQDLDDLYRKSLDRRFRPQPLGLPVTISGDNTRRELTCRNVVACLPGKTDRQIVVSAHVDHLGANSALKGDTIFNGAIDNGSAVAAMVLVAKVLRESGVELRHTVTFLACQAEEHGLLGSRYFAEKMDRDKAVANLNFESAPVWEVSTDVMAVGGRYSTLGDLAREIAAERGWGYSEFSMVDQGFFFRSDQFSFARVGVPSVWLSAGESFQKGRNHLRDFFRGAYHTVDDEYDPGWPLDSLRQTVELTVRLIERLDASAEKPHWKEPLPFPEPASNR